MPDWQHLSVPQGKIWRAIGAKDMTDPSGLSAEQLGHVPFTGKESLPLRVGAMIASKLGLMPHDNESIGDFHLRVWGDVLNEATKRKMMELMATQPRR